MSIVGKHSAQNGWVEPAAKALRASTAGPLAGFDPESTPGFTGDKKLGEELLGDRGAALADLQEMLYANGRTGGTRSVLLVLQGMDTAGKGGIVRHVGGLMDPQGLTIKGFGKPTPEELSHDFLWRIRKAVPPAGQIGIFDRSQYEDVLPVRVHNLVPRSEWEKRYALINQFERELADAGTTIIKCALVISKKEQKKRLLNRLDRPDKYWKFNPADIEERYYWDDYLEAYQAIFDRCDTDYAPWYLIPANRKWFSRLAVCELLLGALEGLDLTWPPADFDVKATRKLVESLPN